MMCLTEDCAPLAASAPATAPKKSEKKERKYSVPQARVEHLIKGQVKPGKNLKKKPNTSHGSFVSPCGGAGRSWLGGGRW